MFTLNESLLENAFKRSVDLHKPRLYDFRELELRDLVNVEIVLLLKYFNEGWRVKSINEDYVIESERLRGECDLVLERELEPGRVELKIVDFKLALTKDETWDLLYYSSLQWPLYLLLTGATQFEFHLLRNIQDENTKELIPTVKVKLLDLSNPDTKQLYNELIVTALRARNGVEKSIKDNMWIKTGACYDNSTVDNLCPFFNHCILKEPQELKYTDPESKKKFSIKLNEWDRVGLREGLINIGQSNMKMYLTCPKKLYLSLLAKEHGIKGKGSNSQKLGSIVGDTLKEFCRQVREFQLKEEKGVN